MIETQNRPRFHRELEEDLAPFNADVFLISVNTGTYWADIYDRSGSLFVVTCSSREEADARGLPGTMWLHILPPTEGGVLREALIDYHANRLV